MALSVPMPMTSSLFRAHDTTTGGEENLPPRFSQQPDQELPSHERWYMERSVPSPKTSIRLEPHEQTAGTLENTPPRDCQPAPQELPSQAGVQTACTGERTDA